MSLQWSNDNLRFNDCNDNGFRLKTFCRDKNLCITPSYFDPVKQDQYTWYSVAMKTKKASDQVLGKEFVQEYVTHCVEFNFDSDHCLLQMPFVIMFC